MKVMFSAPTKKYLIARWATVILLGLVFIWPTFSLAKYDTNIGKETECTATFKQYCQDAGSSQCCVPDAANPNRVDCTRTCTDQRTRCLEYCASKGCQDASSTSDGSCSCAESSCSDVTCPSGSQKVATIDECKYQQCAGQGYYTGDSLCCRCMGGTNDCNQYCRSIGLEGSWHDHTGECTCVSGSYDPGDQESCDRYCDPNQGSFDASRTPRCQCQGGPQTTPYRRGDTIPLEVGIGVNNTTNGITPYIGLVYNFAAAIVGVVAVIMIVIGGIQYSTSAGNKAAMGSAKETITSAIIGLVIVLMSYLILGVFSSRFTNLSEPVLNDIVLPPDTDWSGNCPAGYEAFTSETNCKDTCREKYNTDCSHSPAGNGKSEAWCCLTQTPPGNRTVCSTICENAIVCFRTIPCEDLGKDQCDAKEKEYCAAKHAAVPCGFDRGTSFDNPQYDTGTCHAKKTGMNETCRQANCGAPDFNHGGSSKYDWCCSAPATPP